jgi:hypothetical protein
MVQQGLVRTTHDGGHAQGGGHVWRRGGVDNRPGKVNALFSPEDGLAEDGGGDFWSVYTGVR